MEKLKTLKDLENLRIALKRAIDPKKTYVTICSGTGCQAHRCENIIVEFEKELTKQKLESKVEIRKTGCLGFCERGPVVIIYPKGIFYQKVRIEDVSEIMSKTVVKNEPIERLLYEDPQTKERIAYEKDIPFYKFQTKYVLGNNNFIDPAKIEEYISIGGYASLGKTLSKMKPEEVIDQMKKSELKGRGGAGFPAGLKWELCRKEKGDEKYIVCNGDEGDPGAFMDEGILEGNPHVVIEGMLIGAYAIGATKGYIYIRYEYPRAVKSVERALEQARECGLLGEKILGSNFNFDIVLKMGAGAFVSGEETALMASIEGKKGEPRQRPPFPAQKGIFGKPTNINNVETWATVPLIIEKGADWFAKIGTDKSKGTKIFSLVGKINNTGLVEVPMGLTLRDMIYKIGGGVPNNKKFKAIQTGGPSGGCIPESLLDLPIDYEKLKEAGSIMGSGGLVVMDEDTCMVDIAKFFLEFLMDESCGKCLICREGIERMLEIVTKITEGKGTKEDIELLQELADVVADASMCGLGQTSPNPVLSTLKYFKDEYMAHINDKKCPAGVCKSLLKYDIQKEKCTGCGLCKINCPQGAISGERGKPHTVNQEKCIKCGICYDNCKFKAIKR